MSSENQLNHPPDSLSREATGSSSFTTTTPTLTTRTNSNRSSTDTNGSSNLQQTQGRHRQQMPIRVDVRSHTGRTLPSPSIQFGQNGQMHLNMGRGNVRYTHTLPPFPRQNGHSSTMNVRVVRIDPLIPQPIHNTATPPVEDSESYDFSRLKCVICLEFMKDPVGCGKCASRFCRSCLSRVVNEAKINNSNAIVKCPTCRVEMTSHFVTDEALKKEIYSDRTVQCRHEGCSERIALPLVVDHENECYHATFKCRYATFGCKWKGKRGELSNHEHNECHLHKVKDLVDQFRKLQADHSTRLDILHQQTTGLVQMSNIIRQHFQREQRKSATNVFELLEYCHLITCSNPYFLSTKDRWTALFRNHESMASITNFLVFLPTLILFATTSSFGMKTTLSISTSSQPDSDDDIFLLADGILCLSIGFLGTLMVAANFVDAQSSRTWLKYKISKHFGAPSLIRDILSLSCFTILVSTFEVHGASTIKCSILWLLLLFSSTFFPALVMHLSQITAFGSIPPGGARAASTILPFARSFEPIYFGLRYSVIAFTFGVLASLDAAILINFLPKEQRTEKLLLKNAFFGDLPKSASISYFVAKAAIMVGARGLEWNDTLNDIWLSSLEASILAFASLLGSNYIIHQLLETATQVARNIYTKSQAELANGLQGGGPQKAYDILGMTSFSFWFFTLVMITQV